MANEVRDSVRERCDLLTEDYQAAETQAGQRPQPQIVFPPDNRQRVTDTTAYPYITQGQLIMQFPNGKRYHGTGTLIDKQYVLTAAHNLFGNDIGGWANAVWFAPARNGDDVPYGFLPASSIFVTEDYRTLSPPDPNSVPVEDVTLYTEDFGLVRLKDPINLPFMGMYAASDAELNRVIQISGYPGDKPEGTMWTDHGVPTGVSEEFLFYRISTFRGQSGAALIADIPLPIGKTIVGVHVAGAEDLDTNFAVRLDNWKIKKVQEWMNSV